MTKEQANAIYDILVSQCGAPEQDRFSFVCAQTDGAVSEWRFGGKLGFGGKFWCNGGRLYVSCYPEDLTPTRESLIQAANTALAEHNH